MPPDTLDVNVALEQGLFAAVLGLALGLVVAGVIRWFGDARRSGLWLAASGLALGFASGASSFDASPFHPVTFRMKPFFSEVGEGAILALCVLVPAAAVAAVFAFWPKLRGLRPLAAAVPAVTALAVGGLVWVDVESTPGHPRHPSATVTGRTLQATKVIDGLEAATGLAFAPNGDVATVEIFEARFRLYTPAEDGFRVRSEALLPVGSAGLAMDVAFHPQYPSEPYVWVTAQVGESDTLTFRIFRGRVTRDSVEFEPVLEWVSAGVVGNHYGGALAVCDGSLFMSVGDGEPGGFHLTPIDPAVTNRQKAQELEAAAGKILRWDISGGELASDKGPETLPIFALGFRNPFGMTCALEPGQLIVGENGSVGHDQVRRVKAGSNHEWPLSVERNVLERPLLDTGRVVIAPTGVVVRPGTDGYQILISAFTSGSIYALSVDGAGQPGELRQIVDVENGAYAIALDARGCAYFTDSSALWRIEDGRC